MDGMSRRSGSKIGSASRSFLQRSVSQTSKDNSSSRASMQKQFIPELPELIPIQLIRRTPEKKELSTFQRRQILSDEIISRSRHKILKIENQQLTTSPDDTMTDSVSRISSWQNIKSIGSKSVMSADVEKRFSNRQSRQSESRKLSNSKKSIAFQPNSQKSGRSIVRASTKKAKTNRIKHDTKAKSGTEIEENFLKKSEESKSSESKKAHRKSKSISGGLLPKDEGRSSPESGRKKSRSPASEKANKSQATKRSVSGKGRRSMRKSKSPDNAVRKKSKGDSRKKSEAKKSASRERSPRGKSPKKKLKGPPRPSVAKSTKSKKKSRGSQTSGKRKKGSESKNAKKGKKVKEKVVKLNRKAIYKDLRNMEKILAGENMKTQKLQWDKDKLYFYWNCAVGKLLKMNKNNSNLKKKLEKMSLELKHALPSEYWKKMHQARLSREEALQAKNDEFAAMIVQLRDAQKAKADSLFKGIQTEVNDTYLIGQRHLSDIINIRKEYTENMTATLFQAREKMRVLEIEMNCKYGPILEEFEDEMKKMRNQVPKERQERLQRMLADSRSKLVEMVNVYMNILHHNFIEVCHTASVLKELKIKEKQLESERNELVKRRNRIKERTEYLHDRISHMKRQVNAGKEARKKLHRIIEDQQVLQTKTDIALINKELAFQDNVSLHSTLQKMSDKVDQYYLKVKRHFLKTVIVKTALFKERALQLTNYNATIKHLFNVEADFLEEVKTFKNHEEFEDLKEGVKVSFGSFHPHTLEELERETEEFEGSLHTAVIFFRKRLRENFLSLDDLHFFIKRRSPLGYMKKVAQEENELLKRLKSNELNENNTSREGQHVRIFFI